MLELEGHDAVLVHNGLEALETAKKLKPDFILLDIGLPGMNGYDVCRELRKDAAFKDTVIIRPNRLGPGARSADGQGSGLRPPPH